MARGTHSGAFIPGRPDVTGLDPSFSPFVGVSSGLSAVVHTRSPSQRTPDAVTVGLSAALTTRLLTTQPALV